MARADSTGISELVRKYEPDLLKEWLSRQLASVESRRDLISESLLRDQSTEFLGLFRRALESGADVGQSEWQPVREFLENLSRSRARQGFTPTETAMFVYSLKEPLFDRIQREHGNDANALGPLVWEVTTTLDKLGLYTTEVYMKGREEVIGRQQREMLELSTPVVELWEGVLALPLIGTLDSERTQVVMENLLQQIVSTGAGIAIIDITGVPTVDTLVAQHLLKTVAAARLMGADCIISGIRPQIAQTIVHLGVELGQVTTKATLSDAFAIALRRNGMMVTRANAATARPEPPQA
jgi:rsbT co-antagonist protein RsbR